MLAPPGLRAKKPVSIITNAPSTAAAGEPSKKANLSNSDFRSLLERSKTRERSGNDTHDEAEEKERRALQKAKKAKSYERWQAKKAAMTQQQAQAYRDRAAERRDDANPDYKDTEEFQGEVDIEKSKFLGGDLEHTHLVKGLDYALLQKTKAALEREEEERLEKAFEESETLKKKEAKKKDEAEATKSDEPRYITHLGRAIYECMISKPQTVTAKDKLSQFLPGRMTFEFELDENFANPLPTTLLQPKSDLPAADERLSGMVTPDIRKRISKVMEYLGQGSHVKKGAKDKKKKKKDGEGPEVRMDEAEENNSEKEEQHGVSAEDDDIFADVGSSYVPAESTTAVDVRTLVEKVKRERNRREEVEESSEPVPSVKTEDRGTAVSHKPEISQAMIEPKRTVREAGVPKREQDPNYVDTVYDDEFATRGAFVVDDDSEDEEMGGKDASGRTKKLVRPWSDKDAKWSKQALAEDAKNSKDDQKVKEQKFEKQLLKIQQVMKDRNQGEKHKKPADVDDERSQKRNRILLKTPAHA